MRNASRWVTGRLETHRCEGKVHFFLLMFNKQKNVEQKKRDGGIKKRKKQGEVEEGVQALWGAGVPASRSIVVADQDWDLSEAGEMGTLGSWAPLRAGSARQSRLWVNFPVDTISGDFSNRALTVYSGLFSLNCCNRTCVGWHWARPSGAPQGLGLNGACRPARCMWTCHDIIQVSGSIWLVGFQDDVHKSLECGQHVVKAKRENLVRLTE